MNFTFKVLPVVALALALSCGVANAAVTSSNMNSFVKNFCSADIAAKGLQEKVFLVSSGLFKDKETTFSCPDGDTYKMYREDATNDPGHYVFNIVATKQVGDVYDCDGKADMGMKIIGINCYPVKDEVAQHRK